jgi:hypothetical protein
MCCTVGMNGSRTRRIGSQAMNDACVIAGKHNGYEVIADRIVPTADHNEAIRAALRPMFLEAHAAGRV